MANAWNMLPKVSLFGDFYKENNLIFWEGDDVLFLGGVYVISLIQVSTTMADIAD